MSVGRSVGLSVVLGYAITPLRLYACVSASVSLCVSLLLVAPLRAQGTARFGIPMRTRDGVKLVSDVWMPADTGRWPVVLSRTP
jgi:hypothetical protein